jgi:hypothetical protein
LWISLKGQPNKGLLRDEARRLASLPSVPRSLILSHSADEIAFAIILLKKTQIRMLLRESQIILHHVQNDVRADIRELPGNQRELLNRIRLSGALSALSRVPTFGNSAAGLLSHEWFNNDSPLLGMEHQAAFTAAVSAISVLVNALAIFLDDALGPPPTYYISVRLPPAETTDATAKYINSVHLALDQPIRRLGHEPLRVSLVEPGSTWLELATSTVGSLAALGTLITLATQGLKVRAEKARVDQERAKADQEKAKADQENAKANQEKAKADQENAKANQEKAKVDQEIEKADQEASKAAQERYRSSTAQLESARKALEYKIEIHILQRKLAMQELLSSHNVFDEESRTFLHASIEQLEELMQQQGECRLQLHAPPEAQAAFPPEALPEIDLAKPTQIQSRIPNQLPPRSPAR